MTAKQLVKKIQRQFKSIISDATEFRGEFTIEVLDANQILEVCRYAKEQLDFDYLVDLCSIDNDDEAPRWTVVYHIYSYNYFRHLRLKVNVGEEESKLPSVASIWRTANWHEREVFDMMGIDFIGHPDMRRILMWEGYPYHPLRKEFPLAGKPTEMPDVAFTGVAPMEGGPFVTSSCAKDTISAEPRAKGES